MPKYRKKAIIVDAVKITPQLLKSKQGAEHFTQRDGKTFTVTYLSDTVLIETIEGTMVGEIGDYIITGAIGEKYLCRGDIFHHTYEPLEEAAEEQMRDKED